MRLQLIINGNSYLFSICAKVDDLQWPWTALETHIQLPARIIPTWTHKPAPLAVFAAEFLSAENSPKKFGYSCIQYQTFVAKHPTENTSFAYLRNWIVIFKTEIASYVTSATSADDVLNFWSKNAHVSVGQHSLVGVFDLCVSWNYVLHCWATALFLINGII